MAVLIVTMPNDADALAVKLAIDHLGEECEIFYPADFADEALWSFDPDNNVLLSSYRNINQSIHFDKFDSVWMRRPCGLMPRKHVADIRERVAAESESSSFANSILRIIEHDKFVASPLSSTRPAQEKCYQFRLARKVGLDMPETLISNSLDQIVDFYNRCNENMIYKTLVPMLWGQNDLFYSQVRTTVIDDLDILLTSDIISAPGIYQKKIEKKAELRVTILGETILSLKKFFPNRSSLDLSVDWRGMHKGSQYEPHELPDDISKKCIELLHELNLTMGSFDFIIDPDDNYYFLEVNPQGQFIWADQICPGLNHLEAMAEFLIAKDPEFKYTRRDRIKLAQFNDPELYKRLTENESQLHYGNLLTFQYGQISVPLIEPVPL